MPIPKTKAKYTYQDYLTWPNGERWEIIDGVAYNMAPAPSWEHQDIIGNLDALLRSALKGKKCRVGLSPLDVILTEHDIVQPDLVVVCDPNKISSKGVRGAPELVIEVLSPSTAKRDRLLKKNLYELHGVHEYLLIDPVHQYVENFALQENGKFTTGEVFDASDILTLHAIGDLKIELREVFGLEKLLKAEEV